PREPQRPQKGGLRRFHEPEEVREMHDPRQVGIGKLDAPQYLEFVRHVLNGIPYIATKSHKEHKHLLSRAALSVLLGFFRGYSLQGRDRSGVLSRRGMP